MELVRFSFLLVDLLNLFYLPVFYWEVIFFFSFKSHFMIQPNLKKEILDLLQDDNFIRSLSVLDESPAMRYCQSIKLLLRQENVRFFRQFLCEYVLLINSKSIPIFKVPTVLVLYKKWLRYPEIMNEITYISSKIKAKSIDIDFWNQFILSTAVDKVKPVIQTARLNLLICLFNSKALKVEECAKNGIVIDALLKLNIHQDDFLALKSKLKDKDHSYYRMFFIIRRCIELKVPGLEFAEMIKIHFSTPDRSFKHSTKTEEFYLLIEHKFPDDYLMQLRKMDLGKLFHIYQLRPELFHSIDLESANDLTLNSILQHLFRDFMFSGVFLNAFSTNQISSTEMTWFNDELNGKNIVNSKNIPFKITKKAAHHFRCLPSSMELSVTRALIYSSIFSSVKDEQFAMVVARSIRSLDQANYWIDTMVLLQKNGLRSVQVREVMDFLQEKVIIGGETINLKNKSIRNLMREIDLWHEQIRETRIHKRVGTMKLVQSEIEPYFADHEGESYIIKQIKRTNELYEEGSYLHHCVYTYRKYCLAGSTFIFSLRTIDENADEIPLITIEVVSNEIRQTKGKFNRLPSEQEKKIIQEWAQEKQLKFAC